jgi:hypothetical protein
LIGLWLTTLSGNISLTTTYLFQSGFTETHFACQLMNRRGATRECNQSSSHNGRRLFISPSQVWLQPFFCPQNSPFLLLTLPIRPIRIQTSIEVISALCHDTTEHPLSSEATSTSTPHGLGRSLGPVFRTHLSTSCRYTFYPPNSHEIMRSMYPYTSFL